MQIRFSFYSALPINRSTIYYMFGLMVWLCTCLFGSALGWLVGWLVGWLIGFGVVSYCCCIFCYIPFLWQGYSWQQGLSPSLWCCQSRKQCIVKRTSCYCLWISCAYVLLLLVLFIGFWILIARCIQRYCRFIFPLLILAASPLFSDEYTSFLSLLLVILSRHGVFSHEYTLSYSARIIDMLYRLLLLVA